MLDMKKLRSLAEKQGITNATELHCAVARSDATISHTSVRKAWIDGIAGLKTLRALSRALGCRIDDLMEDHRK